MLASDDALLPAGAARRLLLILRVAWRTRSGYEWSAASRMGADAGLTEQQIDAVADGPAAEVWTPLERTLLTVVDDMIDNRTVGDATWVELAAHFEPSAILGIALPDRGLPVPGGCPEQRRAAGHAPGVVQSQSDRIAISDHLIVSSNIEGVTDFLRQTGPET